MKVIFLCGSLKPGFDGVGDYSRRMAGTLISQGHQAQLVSLMDKDISLPETSIQDSDGIAVTVLRIPAAISSRLRFLRVQNFIQSFNPDWISLQYVPFSFHDRGLHYGLRQALANLGKDIRWHIMFHELWLGRNKSSSVKTLILSFLQQVQVKMLVRTLKPILIHTHLPVFRLKLSRIGIIAKPLPLFSNIKVVPGTLKRDANLFKIAFFSQVETTKPVIDFINELSIQAIQNGLSPQLILIGGNEKKMSCFTEQFKRECPSLNGIIKTGFLNTAEISAVISDCDLGITPIPTHALGKSGSVAAFLAHGVPVAAPVVHAEYGQTRIGFFNAKEIDAVILNPKWEKFEQVKKAALMVPVEIQVDAISKIFYSDLTATKQS